MTVKNDVTPGSLGAYMTRHPQHAFTLFEVMVVVVIIAVAGLVVIPIANNVTSPQLRTAANVVAADIEFCQSECINNPSSLRQIQFDTIGNKYWIATAASASTPITNPDDGQPYQNDFKTGRTRAFSGVTIKTVSVGTGNILKFDTFGQPTSTATDATIVLSVGAKTMTLTVNASTGDITIQ